MAILMVIQRWAQKHMVEDMAQHLHEHPWPQGLQLLNDGFAVWTLAGELWHLSRTAIEQHDWPKYMGI